MHFSNDEPEVIDPDDPRYKRPEDFHRQNNRSQERDFYNEDSRGGRHIYYQSYGCTPFGCLPGCLVSIVISIILTILLNMFFW
ncbi:hypothetical protein [Staphylococcus ratti]|uniref:Uncharacterized protein n=1 Tax=Staphylococcus ratti TaxID=2892440 RepID=A0ABY3PBH2_9STAP|nr:hypothetical protein [Staphylococcus ratti]UEX89667.1 hypothetical protein LN051_08825 [Staphylococcus ratti]